MRFDYNFLLRRFGNETVCLSQAYNTVECEYMLDRSGHGRKRSQNPAAPVFLHPAAGHSRTVGVRGLAASVAAHTSLRDSPRLGIVIAVRRDIRRRQGVDGQVLRQTPRKPYVQRPR